MSRLSRGVAIYQTYATPYWQARVWDAKASRYVVRSTKETGKLKARQVADEIAHELKDPAPRGAAGVQLQDLRRQDDRTWAASS